MKHEYRENGRFRLFTRRYKKEAKYEARYIEKVKEDFMHHSFGTIEDVDKYLREIALYNNSPSDTYTLKHYSNSKWTDGSIATKTVEIKLKENGNYILGIWENFQPGECWPKEAYEHTKGILNKG